VIRPLATSTLATWCWHALGSVWRGVQWCGSGYQHSSHLMLTCSRVSLVRCTVVGCGRRAWQSPWRHVARSWRMMWSWHSCRRVTRCSATHTLTLSRWSASRRYDTPSWLSWSLFPVLHTHTRACDFLLVTCTHMLVDMTSYLWPVVRFIYTHPNIVTLVGIAALRHPVMEIISGIFSPTDDRCSFY